MTLRSTKCFIFDMDGVLWNSDFAHYEAYKRVLLPLDIKVPTYSKIAGCRTDEVIYKLLKDNSIEPESDYIAELTKKKRDEAYVLLKEEKPLANNCIKVLNTLSKQYKLALVSSASIRNVQLFLDVSGTYSLFSVVLSGENVAKAKPSPDIYFKALSQMSISPDLAVVIEDSISGIRAARAAKIPTIAITTDTGLYKKLKHESVIGIISNLSELLDGNFKNYRH